MGTPAVVCVCSCWYASKENKMTCIVLCCAADVTIIDLTSKVTLTVGSPIPYVPPVPDACKDQGLKCPLAPNVLATFKTGLTIPKIPLKDVSAL